MMLAKDSRTETIKLFCLIFNNILMIAGFDESRDFIWKLFSLRLYCDLVSILLSEFSLQVQENLQNFRVDIFHHFTVMIPHILCLAFRCRIKRV